MIQAWNIDGYCIIDEIKVSEKDFWSSPVLENAHVFNGGM